MAKAPLPDLGGLIQTKGAPRPDSLSQRSAAGSAQQEQPRPPNQPEAPEIAAAPAAPKSLANRSAATPEPRTKSLTLRLSETQYQRLRRFAFERGLSHQDVIESALMEYLDRLAE